jgi:hypothetical protein
VDGTWKMHGSGEKCMQILVRKPEGNDIWETKA